MKDSRKIRAALFLFIVKCNRVFCWPIIFLCSGFLPHWMHAKECGRGVLFLGQNKPLHRQRETKYDWMSFEGVLQNKKLVHVPWLLSLLLWSADSTVPASSPCGNVDHLPPHLPALCKADSPASEQKTDIKWVIPTLLSWQGSSPL